MIRVSRPADCRDFNCDRALSAPQIPRRNDEVYEQAGFDLAIDYAQSAVPPLTEIDQTWTQGILQSSNS